jgi:3-deoxy-D-arabino-heptulosonate 7-phosphate (DAHP) synthase class II
MPSPDSKFYMVCGYTNNKAGQPIPDKWAVQATTTMGSGLRKTKWITQKTRVWHKHKALLMVYARNVFAVGQHKWHAKPAKARVLWVQSSTRYITTRHWKNLDVKWISNCFWNNAFGCKGGHFDNVPFIQQWQKRIQPR